MEIGDDCPENGCDGKLQEMEKEGCCSCHISPPCSYCTDSRLECNTCGSEIDEPEPPATSSEPSNWYKDLQKRHDEKMADYRRRLKEKDRSKFIHLAKGHTHFSMIHYGIAEKGMTREDLLKEVQGTFGGRFVTFRENTDGYFEYVAYTD